MKLLSVILMILLASPAWAFPPLIAGKTASGGAAATCQAGTGSQWTNASSGDYWPLGTGNSQYVANSTSIEICQINILSYGTGTYHLELWSTASGAGTQYGGNSDVKGGGGSNCATGSSTAFTFSPAVAITGNFYIRMVVDTSSNGVCSSSAGTNTAFGDTSANLVTSGSERNEDVIGTIYYMQ